MNSDSSKNCCRSFATFIRPDCDGWAPSCAASSHDHVKPSLRPFVPSVQRYGDPADPRPRLRLLQPDRLHLHRLHASRAQAIVDDRPRLGLRRRPARRVLPALRAVHQDDVRVAQGIAAARPTNAENSCVVFDMTSIHERALPRY